VLDVVPEQEFSVDDPTALDAATEAAMRAGRE
jgi:hypothetical protein